MNFPTMLSTSIMFHKGIPRIVRMAYCTLDFQTRFNRIRVNHCFWFVYHHARYTWRPKHRI